MLSSYLQPNTVIPNACAGLQTCLLRGHVQPMTDGARAPLLLLAGPNAATSRGPNAAGADVIAGRNGMVGRARAKPGSRSAETGRLLADAFLGRPSVKELHAHLLLSCADRGGGERGEEI